MPIYQYACTDCSEQLEVRQSFTDDALTVCPVCEGRLRKVLSPVGVVFKGSGFYRTDSRNASRSSTSDSPGTKESASSSRSDSSSSSSSSTSGAGDSTSSSSSGSSSSGGSTAKAAAVS